MGRVTRSGGVDGMTVVRQAPARYDAAGVRVSQHLATSADGTRVPYFQIGRPVADAEGRAAGGPTILYDSFLII